MTITVIGTGFVGVVTAAVYASLGHQVWGLDIDPQKITALSQSQVPFYEPNLEELLRDTQKKGNLHFTTSYQQAITESQLIVIAVGTPSASDGGVDLSYVLSTGRSLAPFLKSQTVVAVKSTVPPGSLDKLTQVISDLTQVEFETASLPEFLREGSAVADTLHPDRVVIGASSDRTFDLLTNLHMPLCENIIQVSPQSAQMAKYSANAYLATRITFINQIADLCQKNGADVEEVVQAIGQDERIGTHYWYPGLGYGGSCFPKDVKELAYFSRQVGEGDNLFNKIDQINSHRITRLMTEYDQFVAGWQDKKVTVLGVSFKPNTDDTREAPALVVVPELIKARAQVTIFDPKAKWNPKWGQVTQVDDLQLACQDADVIMILTEWPEIISFDYTQVRSQAKPQYVIDTRNRLDPCPLVLAGFSYRGVGRQINCPKTR